MPGQNDSSAYGASKGLAYVLPWDTMMQYNQQVEAKKQQFVAENEQKMARIVDMEKEQQVGMPSYDKALENHYEGLHLEMGRVITKYRDPFASIDGMREMKAIQNKYLNNEFISNAGKTKDAYAQLKADYAANRITPEGFAEEEAKYNAIANGDAKNASKVYQYARPDYTPIEEIIAKNTQFYDKTTLKDTRNQTITGYTDSQRKEIADLTIAGPQNVAAILKVKSNLTERGQDITPDNLEKELIRLHTVQFPNKIDNKYYQSSESDKDGLGKIMPSDYQLQTGQISKDEIGHHILLNADKSIANLNELSFGQNNNKYNTDFSGKAIYIGANKYDPSIQNVSAKISVPRQTLVDSYVKKIQNSVSGINTVGGIFITGTRSVDSNGKPTTALSGKGISKEDYYKLAANMGFADPVEATQILQEYNNGDYQNSSFSSFGKERLQDKGTDGIYSANALLFHIINKISSPTINTAEIDGATRSIMQDINGGKEGVDWVYVNDVNVTPRITNSSLMENDVAQNITSAKTGQRALQRQISGTNTHIPLGNGWTGGRNMAGQWSGLFKNVIGGQPVSVGADNFGDLARSPETLAEFNNYMNIVDRSRTPKEDKGKTLIERVFEGLTPDVISRNMAMGGDKSLLARSILAYQKMKDGVDLTPEEKILFRIHQEYIKLAPQ